MENLTNSRERALAAEELFELAQRMDASERTSFVAENSNGDTRLEKMVLELLVCDVECNGEPDFILNRPIVQSDGVLAPGAGDVQAEKEGDVIGRYKLLQRIGEGGMGVVYMAEQLSGVRRRVALKVIKLGMDTRQVVARFDAERQAMAMFDHPGITRILDAGATRQGRPYYAMELVRGRGLVEFTLKHQLSTNDKLQLFNKICMAVHHAHQKGIIHRDLKPSNILVSMVDGQPCPKVIDFGIAKALNHRLTDKTVFTKYSAMIGTPQYMSPEQAESSGVDVDTRSDIYGLGVMLYELITGTTPLCKKSLADLNPIALVETLKNQCIETPSTRISRINDDRVDDASTGEVQVTSMRIPRELDWIIMKSLSQERANRYQSAAEFANDIGRFLNGDVVEAAAPSKFYRFSTYFRKHRFAISVSISTVVTVVLCSLFCLWFGISSYYANQEKGIALSELEKRNAELVKAKTEIENRNLATRRRAAIQVAATRASFMEKEMPELLRQQMPIFPGMMQGQEPALNIVRLSAQGLWEMLGQLKHREILEPEFAPVREFLQDLENREAVSSKAFMSRIGVQEEDMVPPENLSDLELMMILDGMRPFEDEAQRLAQQSRFFEYLLEEYRREFGESDPHVASALHLFAAALIEQDRLSEARFCLRESLAINRTLRSRETANKLLEIATDPRNIESKMDSVTKGVEFSP